MNNHVAKTPSLCLPSGSQEEHVDLVEFVSTHLEGKEAVLVLFLNNIIYLSISNSISSPCLPHWSILLQSYCAILPRYSYSFGLFTWSLT